MINRKSILLFVAAVILFACGDPTPPSGEAYSQLAFGSIKPEGWLRSQMEYDMEGFAGNLDLIVPDLVNDPIYSTGRLHSNSKAKELGNLKAGDVGDDDQYKWWNSETQSNWWDGYIRTALLLENEKYLKRAEAQIDAILATQDGDGYLGIYTPDTRYSFVSENGELWAKATLYRYLLGYYEATGDERVWDALVRAVDNTMEGYRPEDSDPFNAGTSYSGGTAHGLVFTDLLDRMWQLTGQQRYMQYALFLYLNYSANFMYEKDAQLDNILDPECRLMCHGVHSYEHLRPVILAQFASAELREQRIIDKYLEKIRYTTTATGGAIGDEWIGGRMADAELTGYEFCSLHELVDSYSVLMQKRGDPGLGNRIENIFYNAAGGMRHPRQSLIAYLKTDNSYRMNGTKNGHEEAHLQTRYKYSAAHQDNAVCCVPNAGRISAYFLQRSWMKQGDKTLVANLLAPNRLETQVRGRKIEIVNHTEYPYSNDMEFTVTVEKPVDLILKIRIPDWAAGIECTLPYSIDGEYLVFAKEFKGEETIGISFEADVRVLENPSGGNYFAYGALIYARPISGKEIEGREYPHGFTDLMYVADDTDRYEYISSHHAEFRDGNIVVKLKNKSTGKVECVELIPLSKTILRQAAF